MNNEKNWQRQILMIKSWITFFLFFWGGVKNRGYLFSCRILLVLSQRPCFEVFGSILNKTSDPPHQKPNTKKQRGKKKQKKFSGMESFAACQEETLQFV